MKPKQNLRALSISLLFLISGCHKSGQTFVIENKTNTSIEDINISNGFNKAKKDKLNRKDKTELSLDFDSNNTHSDGNYLFEYKIDNVKHKRIFGYYTNGIPSSKKVFIKILKDSIVIDEVY